MSTIVRLNAYEGVITMPLTNQNQLATNGAFMLKEPCMASQVITATGVAQSSTTALSPNGCRILRVEVHKGSIVHYRVNLPNATPVSATTSDATIDGKDNLDWGPGYTISLIEASTEA